MCPLIIILMLLGLMFFTVWGNGPAKLESANMDGSNRKLLINTNIVYPQGITLDYPNRFSYFYFLFRYYFFYVFQTNLLA